MSKITTTGSALVEHWNWAAEKGIMNRNSAGAFRAACSQVLGALGDGWKDADVTSIDVSDAVRRFKHLRGKNFTPQSLDAYERRFKQAVASFLEYVRDPGAWRPSVRERTPNGRSSKGKRESAPATTGENEPSFLYEKRVGLMDYPFPLREGQAVRLMLPRDLTLAEARRLYAFMKTLAADFDPAGDEQKHS